MEIYYPSRSLRSAKSPFLIGKVTYITYEQAIFQSYVQSPEAVYRPIYLNLLSECFCLPIGNPLRRIRNWMCLDFLVFLKSKSKCVSRLFSYFVNFGYLRLSKNTRWTFVYVAAVRYCQSSVMDFDLSLLCKVLRFRPPNDGIYPLSYQFIHQPSVF